MTREEALILKIGDRVHRIPKGQFGEVVELLWMGADAEHREFAGYVRVAFFGPDGERHVPVRVSCEWIESAPLRAAG